ncbi:MAG: lysozyme [Bacteroidales bacterium]|nr:lysozyme [Bacteroidales bacterium]
MNLSETGYSFIKWFEGYYSTAYKCPKGKLTIGWGTITYPDGSPVRECDTCNQSQAMKWLAYDVRETEVAIMPLIKVPLSQNKFDSLVSFAYNEGANALATSTLLKVINSKGEIYEDLFVRWNKITVDHDGKDNDGDGVIDEPGEKKPLTGLTNRRKSEFWLYKYNEFKVFK